ncbi:class I SAM-dependent methyltransferase [Plantactinospora endophytica]|uniref:SAM-dependent methyltransferase n=1 Tax=Plantactinospora endophytica TaxID=673535 RepID=A0ABQ4EBE9_9ACTN|nr:class I SAM-dependent methyltransferase [Plantactinospora endophytica]GIG92066.1 SAM-dependent methyltransferase [Plantactinospora endophytica]
MDENVFETAYGGRAARGSAIAATPWEIGRAQPVVEELYGFGAFSGHVLDAGCGTGENALFLAAQGHKVTGVDVAPSAVETARRKAAERGLSADFTVADATRSLGDDGSVDTALDCGLLHSLRPEHRAGYLAALHRVCRPEALAHVLCFSDRVRFDFAGGPRLFDEPTVRGVFGPDWALVHLETATLTALFPGGERDLPCWLATARRS